MYKSTNLLLQISPPGLIEVFFPEKPMRLSSNHGLWYNLNMTLQSSLLLFRSSRVLCCIKFYDRSKGYYYPLLQVTMAT
jgi:hypothetical protein